MTEMLIPFVTRPRLRPSLSSEASAKKAPGRMTRFEVETKYLPFTENDSPNMTELAEQIIREQWSRRNDPNPAIRQQARSLIKTHIFLLRGWRFQLAA